MPTMITLTDVARDCGCTVRTAQRHAQQLGIGVMIGGMRILRGAEAVRLASAIRSAKPGRPVRHPCRVRSDAKP